VTLIIFSGVEMLIGHGDICVISAMLPSWQILKSEQVMVVVIWIERMWVV